MHQHELQLVTLHCTLYLRASQLINYATWKFFPIKMTKNATRMLIFEIFAPHFYGNYLHRKFYWFIVSQLNIR